MTTTRLLAVAFALATVSALTQESRDDLEVEDMWLPMAGHEYVFISPIAGVYMPIVIRFFDEVALVDENRVLYSGEQLLGRQNGGPCRNHYV